MAIFDMLLQKCNTTLTFENVYQLPYHQFKEEYDVVISIDRDDLIKQHSS